MYCQRQEQYNFFGRIILTNMFEAMFSSLSPGENTESWNFYCTQQSRLQQLPGPAVSSIGGEVDQAFAAGLVLPLRSQG